MMPSVTLMVVVPAVVCGESGYAGRAAKREVNTAGPISHPNAIAAGSRQRHRHSTTAESLTSCATMVTGIAAGPLALANEEPSVV